MQKISRTIRSCITDNFLNSRLVGNQFIIFIFAQNNRTLDLTAVNVNKSLRNSAHYDSILNAIFNFRVAVKY